MNTSVTPMFSATAFLDSFGDIQFWSENVNVARFAIIAICLGAVATSVKLTGKSIFGFCAGDIRSLFVHTYYVGHFFEVYFTLFCTSLSFLYSGGWVYAVVYNFVLCTSFSFGAVAAIIGALPICAEKSCKEFAVIPAAWVVFYSCYSTLVLASEGWFGPVAGSDAVGFYFLDEASAGYGMSRCVTLRWLLTVRERD